MKIYYITLLVVSVFTLCCYDGKAFGTTNETDEASAYEETHSRDEEFGSLLKYAESGDAVAQYKLGEMFLSGNRIPKNFTKVLKWYQNLLNKVIQRLKTILV